MAKSNRKQVLGRGLSALLNDPKDSDKTILEKNSPKSITSFVNLPVSRIKTNPSQPRSNFNEESLKELSVSIAELGIIQPITVRKVKAEEYQLISGERRLKATKLAGIDKIPAYIRLANDSELLEMALVENIQREDLDPIEIALSYQRLLVEINLTQEQLSDRIGKKRSTIANYIRLLKLDPVIQTGIRDKFVSMGHGRALINISDLSVQIKLYKKIIKKGLSVRQVEKLVQEIKNPNEKSYNYYSPFLKQSAIELDEIFETSVSLVSNDNGKGYIKILFDSQEKLQDILNKIKGES
ncbi:chromosome partitioning protein ParB [Bacteroidetes bacterium SCGC AAA795-G10]|nr:chromosome partitioning protein ParB [Bacteroidetes bacterium SCGC AAA795-G10]